MKTALVIGFLAASLVACGTMDKQVHDAEHAAAKTPKKPVYTVTSFDGTHYEASANSKSDVQRLEFDLNDVNGFVGGVGQYVLIRYDNDGHKIVESCDSEGNV